MGQPSLTISKILRHLKVILTHKYYVFKYCCKCGIIWRGIVHDLSKFSYTEFVNNARYYVEGKSPIDFQKEHIGYAISWFHHKGRNSHHHEYWFDRFKEGCYATRLPVDDAIESVCDNIAASITYSGKDKFSFTNLYDNWWRKNLASEKMHPDYSEFKDTVFSILKNLEINHDKNLYILNYDRMKKLYEDIVSKNNNPIQVRIGDI